MKEFSDQQVDDILRLKYGRLVSEANHAAYATNATLGKIFKVSGGKIRQLCQERFEKARQKSLPLQEQMQKIKEKNDRRQWGFRFLKPHEVAWIISSNTLKL